MTQPPVSKNLTVSSFILLTKRESLSISQKWGHREIQRDFAPSVANNQAHLFYHTPCGQESLVAKPINKTAMSGNGIFPGMAVFAWAVFIFVTAYAPSLISTR
jgi:hypothetical protein